MQNPNEAKVVSFTNIFDFDYTHAYGGVPYQLRAGVTQLFPWAIGDHLATHLARQALIRKAPTRDDNAADGRGGETTRSDRPLWDDTAIDALKARILKDAFVEQREAPQTEAETYRRKVEELAKQFPELTPETVPTQVPTATVAAGAPIGALVAPAPSAPMTPLETSNYVDKAEVIAALTAKGIAHNPRASRASLEKLLQ